MSGREIRRADFLMALAYATDLATGHSRDFALRSCVLAMRFADIARLDQDTRRSVFHQALLRGLSGNAVKFPVRLVTLAQEVIALNDHHGFESMKAMIAKRAGGGYEPALADLFLEHAQALVAGLDGPVDRATILALEPEPHGMLSEEEAEEAYVAIADMIDMRMPFTFGHSRAVAELAGAAAKRLGLPAADIRYRRGAAY